jgi:dephospho-CoA kinase
MKKLKIAITGGIGGGKSSFCQYLADKGFTVLSADEISKDLLLANKKIKEEIIKNFGREAYSNGELNKQYLAEKVFSNEKSVKKINSIVHPYVITQLEKKMNEVLKVKNIVFVEAALIYEAKMENMFDYIVLITADEDIKKKRFMSTGRDIKEYEKRSSFQIPDDKKRNKADFVFENNYSLEELQNKADVLIRLVS